MSGSTVDEEDISPHVHLTISTEKKQRWIEHAEEHYRGNLSAFIEECVDNSLSDVWVLEDEDEEESDAIDVDLSQLEGLDDINDQLDAIQNQLDVSTSEGTVEQGRLEGEELMKLASQIHDTLPLVSGTMELADLKNAVVELPPDERAKLSGTIDDIARHVERDQVDVWQACLYLENKDQLTIFSLIDEGERRFYELKRGDSE